MAGYGGMVRYGMVSMILCYPLRRKSELRYGFTKGGGGVEIKEMNE